ncbi:MAG: helix-turn-helix transcriptional regulator [Bacteroidales bacterium]|nr:helix-turn-helix transcriptional regulator [Bacteroidales bacterium]MDY3912977.1 helix-turn-helix transcriptional regulator [Sodaliphilus sp.]
MDLTEREKEVLKHLVKGFNSREISEKLFISINTVQYHRKQLLRKTLSRNVAELIGKAYQLSLLEDQD